jgi:hypothetical protein
MQISLENRKYSRRDPSRWPRGTLYLQLALTSLTSGSLSVGLARSRTQATVFFFVQNMQNRNYFLE